MKNQTKQRQMRELIFLAFSYIKTHRKIVCFNWLSRTLGNSTLSSIQKIGNTTLGIVFTNSTLSICLTSILNCSRFAADNGEAVIFRIFTFTNPEIIINVKTKPFKCTLTRCALTYNFKIHENSMFIFIWM